MQQTARICAEAIDTRRIRDRLLGEERPFSRRRGTLRPDTEAVPSGFDPSTPSAGLIMRLIRGARRCRRVSLAVSTAINNFAWVHCLELPELGTNSHGSKNLMSRFLGPSGFLRLWSARLRRCDGGDIRSAVCDGLTVRVPRKGRRSLGMGLAVLSALAGCGHTAQRVDFAAESERLWRENRRLERKVAAGDRVTAELRHRVDNLQGFAGARHADLFRPVKIEIASLTRGANYDDRPGDDGVTVYLRPHDEDGDVVKVPGRITIQLVDTSTPGSPRAVGLCVFDDADALGRLWHGRFGTNHYSLPCPFSAGESPSGPKLTVNAEFVDYLTGATLTTVKEVAVSLSGE